MVGTLAAILVRFSSNTFTVCSDTSDNDIGIPFIFMSEAPGWPLSNVWKSVDGCKPDLDIHIQAKILSQLGAITWKLSQLRFDKIGSLFEEKDGSFQIEESLSRGHVEHDRYILEEIPRGPFTSETNFYDGLISAFSEHAEILQSSHHCFVAPVPSQDYYQSRSRYLEALDLWYDFVTVGGKIDSAINRMDYIIAGDALRAIVQGLKLPFTSPGSFPLYHADLSVNNIYVDDDYNITCIIDWVFASSVPESMLLRAPALPQPRDELSPDLHVPFIDGFIAAMPDSSETSVHRYREILEQGQFFWSLNHLLNLDTIKDYNLFAAIWDSAHGEKDMGQYFLQQRCSPHYTQLYSEFQQEDRPVVKVEKDERDYFRDDVLRQTIARKLRVISEWTTQYTDSPRLRKDMFVADSRLWKWILQCTQDWEDMA